MRRRKTGSCRVGAVSAAAQLAAGWRSSSRALCTHPSHRKSGGSLGMDSLALLFFEWRSCRSSLSGSGWNMVRSLTGEGVERGEGTGHGEGMEHGVAAGESEGVTERSASYQEAPEYACWWLVVFIFTRDFSPGCME